MKKSFLKKSLLSLTLCVVMLLALLAFVSCADGKDGLNGKDGLDGKDGITPEITINADGYWVINGVVSSTKAEGTTGATGATGPAGPAGENGQTPTISINEDGFWVINGVPTEIQAAGTPGAPGATGPAGPAGENGQTPTISINQDGFWVINGVPTEIQAAGTPGAPGAPGATGPAGPAGENGQTPTVTIENGYWVINGSPTDVRAEAINGTNGKDGSLWTVGTEYPASPKAGDLFLNNTTWELFCFDGNSWSSKGLIGDRQEEEAKVVDLVIFMGQSNMAGRGVAAEAPVVQEGHGYEFRAVSDPTKLYPIAEPFGVNENRGVISETTKTGSLVSAFAESYYSHTGVPIVGVSAAQGGKSIDFWATGGDALNETIARYNAAKTYLEENDYTVRHQYMVWLQGEADGKGGMTTDAYKIKLENLFIQMKKQGVEKAMVIRIGERQNNTTVHDAIILAQTELCRTHNDFVLINGMLAGIEGSAMKDDAHFKQSTYNEVGADAGKNMAYYVNTGMEPYFFDPEYNNFYPFGSTDSSNNSGTTTPPTTTEQLIVDVSDPNSGYNFSTLGTVSNGVLTVSTNNTDKYLAPADTVILSDDYSWTCEIIAGKFTGTGGVAACSGSDGYGFITLPYKDGAVEISTKTAGYRFRDETKTLQIDMVMPENYDKDALHHFAIVYDSTTKTFKAYIDYVECEIVYTEGSQGSAFSDTQLNRIFGGYPTDSNAKCDFYYFAFNKKALTTSEMKAMPEIIPDPIVLDVSKSTHDFASHGTVSGDKLTLTQSTTLTLDQAPILTDDADWTLEIVVGNLTAAQGMFANAGVNGSGFVTVPSYVPANVGSGAQFRFRDVGNTFQIDVNLPTDYDPTAKHHFALTYDADTRTFKAYLDHQELTITYTKGQAGGSFNDTELKNIFGGYSATQYLKGDFYYLAFHYTVLEASEMHPFAS